MVFRSEIRFRQTRRESRSPEEVRSTVHCCTEARKCRPPPHPRMPPQRAAMAQQPSPHPPPHPLPPLSLNSSGGRAPKSRRPQVPHFKTGDETGLKIDETSKSATSFFFFFCLDQELTFSPGPRSSASLKRLRHGTQFFHNKYYKRGKRRCSALTRTLPELDLFANLPTSRERVEFVYSLLPPDATSLDRLWPIRIPQKDSRQVYTRMMKKEKKLPRRPWEYTIQ